MIESATGIILRTCPLTDTSLIVRWLTPNFGRIATVAKGARRPKSPFLGKLDLFYLCDFNFYRSRRSELHTLKEVGVRDTHNLLRRNLDYLQQASYCAKLIEQVTETETPLPVIFELLRGWLEALPGQPPPPQTLFAFEIKLLRELGLQPKLEKGNLKPATQHAVRKFLALDWPEASRVVLSPEQLAELRQFLHGFLIYHLGRIPKGRTI